MEVIGKLIVKKETEQISETFRKRDIVVETIGEYPQTIPITLANNKTSLADNINVGEIVKVMINLRGRSWENQDQETMYFLSAQGWSMTRYNPSAQPVYPQQPMYQQQYTQQYGQPMYQQQYTQQPMYQQPQQQYGQPQQTYVQPQYQNDSPFDE